MRIWRTIILCWLGCLSVCLQAQGPGSQYTLDATRPTERNFKTNSLLFTALLQGATVDLVHLPCPKFADLTLIIRIFPNLYLPIMMTWDQQIKNSNDLLHIDTIMVPLEGVTE